MGKPGSGGSNYTRRTHVVRVYADPADAKNNPTSANFIDVEVLDAIAFQIEGGKEVVIDATQNIVPTIVDDTGDGNGQQGGPQTTRLSHMKRITSDDGNSFFDAEILDCWAARDNLGEEWILNCFGKSDSPAEYNTTLQTGDTTATRRVHDEKIAPGGAGPVGTPPNNFILSRRTDAIAFRKQNGYEVILVAPSNDDPNNSDPSAASFITPQGYDPSDTSADAVTPPANTDPNVYVAFPKNPDGSVPSFLTSVANDSGKAAVDMGLLWWIRKVSGSEILMVEVQCTWANTPQMLIPVITFDTNFAYSTSIVTADLSLPPDDPVTFKPVPNFAAKTMPQNAAAQPPIDLAKGLVWWTNQVPPNVNQASGNAKQLVFFNMTRIRSVMPKTTPPTPVQFSVELPAFSQGPPTPPTTGVGNYIWLTGVTTRGNQTGVPPTVINPLPTIADGLGVGPNGYAPYGMLYNETELSNGDVLTNSLGSSLNPTGFLATFNPGFHPTDFPASNPNDARLGFATAAGAEAWAAALNAAWAAEVAQAQAGIDAQAANIQQEIANVEANGGGNPIGQAEEIAFLQAQLAAVQNQTNNSNQYSALQINYNTGGTPAQQAASCTVIATVADFQGPTTFAYDANNNPQFSIPLQPKGLVQTVNSGGTTPAIRILFSVDPTGKVTAQIIENPTGTVGGFTPLTDVTNGKAEALSTT